MARAKRVHSTPRRTASKSKNKPKAKTTTPPDAERSEIIEQCVRYAHAMAAYPAGFEVDGTGDSEYAGAQVLGGKQMEKARRAMLRIVALLSDEARPVTPLELNAMGGVLRLVAQDTENYGNLQPWESVLGLVARAIKAQVPEEEAA